MLSKGQIVKVRISSLAPGGEGISKDYGSPIFIQRAAPGDELQVELFDVRKGFARGRIVEIIAPSQERTTPACKLFKVCGGCQWQHISYEAQLKAKEEIVRQCIAHIGGVNPALVKPVIQAEQVLSYRNKAQFPVRHPQGTSRILAGYFKQDSHELVNVKHCPVQPELMDMILEATKSACESCKISAYDEATHKGLLRHINIRFASSTQEALVILVINEQGFEEHGFEQSTASAHGGSSGFEPSRTGSHGRSADHSKKCVQGKSDFTSDAYAPPLHAKLHLATEQIMEQVSQVAGVLVNFNPHRGNKILGDRTECLMGKPFIEEVLKSTRSDLPSQLQDGIRFRVSASSFFQVHTDQAVKLLEVIFDLAKLETGQSSKLFIVDTYAGVGSIALWLSPIAYRIIAVEENEGAVADGRFNVKHNHASNIEVRLGKVETVLSNMASRKEKPDLLILDPPRKGASPEALGAILRLAPERIIYVSCNPSTLARDLKILEKGRSDDAQNKDDETSENGYKTVQIQPVDLFPQTYHIESVTLLKKVRIK